MKKLFAFSGILGGLLLGTALTVSAQTTAKVPPPEVQALLQKHTCLVCHNVDKKVIGPSYLEVMAKKKYKPQQIVDLIYKPVPANWPGYPAMAPMTAVPKEDAMKIANWMVTLGPGGGKAAAGKAPVRKKS